VGGDGLIVFRITDAAQFFIVRDNGGSSGYGIKNGACTKTKKLTDTDLVFIRIWISTVLDGFSILG
jgi:hypothetical protein